ncbi:MAG: hypothetical protein COB73_04605 [Flavobacteriaceae bacterium]|nr:MAG: hypothetical protein COB73_04605 [Flavobacteriaceae bacterium]
MKSTKRISTLATIFLLLISVQFFGQEEKEATTETEFKPAYIVIVKMHFNSDHVIDFSEWKKTEEEYFDKVISKNDLIMHSGVYRHYLTPDSSEILFIKVFDSWFDFEAALDLNVELIEEAWPDEDERAAFFEKQSSFYNDEHSDEMYSTLPFYKSLETESEEPLLVYMRKNEAGEGGDGYQEYFDNVIAKNKYIKGFFSMKHFFGAHSRDAYEVGVYDNLADIEKAFEENQRLSNEHWADKEEREAFFKEFNKVFKGHGDYIYQTVPELAK